MSIGLALSGGGVKGAAHIGILKAFEEEKIKIKYIGGTSSGSIVATLYAVGYKPDEIYYIFKKYSKKIKYVEYKNIIKLFFGVILSGTIKIDGLNSGNSIYKLINQVCNEKGIYNIGEVTIPMAIPSVDMRTGEIICFSSVTKRGFSDGLSFINDASIGKAVQASCSFPSIFSPCDFNYHKLLDGGIRENVPWREVKILGADKVVSVVFENEVKANCCENLIDVAFRSFELIGKELSKYEIEGSDYLIKVKSKKVSLLDMSKIDEFYELGYLAAKGFLKENNLKMLI